MRNARRKSNDALLNRLLSISSQQELTQGLMCTPALTVKHPIAADGYVVGDADRHSHKPFDITDAKQRLRTATGAGCASASESVTCDARSSRADRSSASRMACSACTVANCESKSGVKLHVSCCKDLSHSKECRCKQAAACFESYGATHSTLFVREWWMICRAKLSCSSGSSGSRLSTCGAQRSWWDGTRLRRFAGGKRRGRGVGCESVHSRSALHRKHRIREMAV